MSSRVSSPEATPPKHPRLEPHEPDNEQFDSEGMLDKELGSQSREVNFELLGSHMSRYNKFGLQQHVSTMTISNAIECPETELQEIFQHLIDAAFSNAEKEGLFPREFGMLLNGYGLTNPIVIPVRSRLQNSTESILAEIDKLEISDKKFTFLSNLITVIITTLSDPSGAGRNYNPKELFAKNKNQRLEVRNNDSNCLFYACEISRLSHDPMLKNLIVREKIKTNIPPASLHTHSQLHRINNNITRQKEFATKLMENANIPSGLSSYGIEHIKLVQQYYDKAYPGLYRIVLIDDSAKTKPLYVGPLGRQFIVAIILEDGHYSGLKAIAPYYKCKKYCADCGVFYNRDSKHTGRCAAKCLKCSRMGYGPCLRDESGFNKTCEKCLQEFHNKECFDLHSQNGTCARYKKCPKCSKTYRRGDMSHECGERYCKTCMVFHHPSRKCFIQPLEAKKEKPSIIMAFDFETTQDTVVKEGVTEHVVNAVSTRWCCTTCADEGKFQEESACEFCKPSNLKIGADDLSLKTFSRRKYWSFYHTEEPLEAFIDWLLEAFESHQNVFVYSHNGGRFDTHFILRSMYARKMKIDDLIMTGNKIYQLKIKAGRKFATLTFRDSYQMMMSPLDSLKKTFDLSTAPKPYFPYLFNNKANKNVELSCLPPPEAYIPNGMMPEKRKKFLEWYEANKNTPFALKTALKEYVENDTAILLEAIVKMRKILKDITHGYDPFMKSCTIAGVAMKTFQALFLKPEQMGIVPEMGYERTDKASDVAIKMLEWLALKEKAHIQHAGNGREKQYRLYDMVEDKHSLAKVDGYIIEQDRGIEILGCYYHGCKKCTEPNVPGANGKLNIDNYNNTIHRLELLKQQISRIDVIWEHEITEQLSSDKEMKEFFTNCQTQGRIEPRDAYFGGLTCAYSMKEAADEKHELSMFDIVSLYPYCNYTGPYPVGHPEIIIPTVKEVNWTKPEHVPYRGIIKARVIPPWGLYLPQIPVRIPGDDRLLFCLCVPCAKALKDQNKKQFDTYSCPHSEAERSFTTTLTDIELKEALLHGYRVTHFYRAWEYSSWSSDIFRGYVQLLMKLKVENSEFPEGVSTDEEKKRFAQEYKEKLGIDIDVSKVGLNPGLRYISKILLNSLWGKFSQRNSLCKAKVITKPCEFFELRHDPRIELCQIIPMNEDTLRVTYRNKTDFVEENDTSNIVISLFTTSIARLKLFSYLRKIERTTGCKILYVDTDSVLFKHPRGMMVLPLGQFLGEMTKEYAEYDIIEFIAGGPKQYALMLRHKVTGEIKYVIKLRGITLNHVNAKRIQYDRFKELIEKYGTDAEEFIECEYNRLGPDQSSNILTKKLVKKYKVVNNKGLLSKDLTLYPFGYKMNFQFFWRGSDFLSNWHDSPFYKDGILFCSNEQYYMFEKALFFGDYEAAERIMNTSNPAVIKHLGKAVIGYDENLWRTVCDEVMLSGLVEKFRQNSHLREKLLSTGGCLLAEASPYDRYWGIGLSAGAPEAKNLSMWRGRNKIGILLMKVRKMMKDEFKNQ